MKNATTTTSKTGKSPATAQKKGAQQKAAGTQVSYL
jgi:hypothetical protein